MKARLAAIGQTAAFSALYGHSLSEPVMTDDPDRRRMLQLSLAAIPALMVLGAADSAFATSGVKPATGAGPEHDFDFFFGAWRIRHRR